MNLIRKLAAATNAAMGITFLAFLLIYPPKETISTIALFVFLVVLSLLNCFLILRPSRIVVAATSKSTPVALPTTASAGKELDASARKESDPTFQLGADYVHSKKNERGATPDQLRALKRLDLDLPADLSFEEAKILLRVRNHACDMLKSIITDVPVELDDPIVAKLVSFIAHDEELLNYVATSGEKPITQWHANYASSQRDANWIKLYEEAQRLIKEEGSSLYLQGPRQVSALWAQRRLLK